VSGGSAGVIETTNAGVAVQADRLSRAPKAEYYFAYPITFEDIVTSPRAILVVEDEEVVRTMVTRFLWEQGYRTLEARNGAEALHLAKLSSTQLSLVITDVMMPVMDGRELGRRLAQELPELPVLYISGYITGDVFNRDGPTASTFLRKPFTEEELQLKVRDLLAASQKNSAAP
jgi:CheY-like chemotaxis protein